MVSSAFLGPILGWGQGPADLVEVQGSAWFGEANVSGNATIHATDGILHTEGEGEVRGHSDTLTVTVYENRRLIYKETPVADYTFWHSKNGTETHRYENASITVDSRETGILEAWSNSSMSQPRFSLEVRPSRTMPVYASPESAQYETHDGQQNREMDAPLFAFGHQASEGERMAPTTFAGAEIGGGIDLVVRNATVVVEDEGEKDEFWLGTYEGKGGPRDSLPAKIFRYAVVSTDDTNLTTTFPSEGKSTFRAHQPVLDVNGSLDFTGHDGHLSAGNESSDLESGEVEIAGDLTLELRAHRDGGETDSLHWWLPATGAETAVEAYLSGEADEVEIDGETVAESFGGSPHPDATFWGRVLGLLLLAWGVLKKGVPFGIGLFTREDPDHERRRTIYEYLEEEGMSHVREIQRATGIPTGSLDHHLEVLREEGYVASIRRLGYKVYFATNPELTWEDMERLAVLAHPTRHRIGELLVKGESWTQRELSEELGLAIPSISRQLKKLVDAGLVDREGRMDSTYEATSLLNRWLAKE